MLERLISLAISFSIVSSNTIENYKLSIESRGHLVPVGDASPSRVSGRSHDEYPKFERVGRSQLDVGNDRALMPF